LLCARLPVPKLLFRRAFRGGSLQIRDKNVPEDYIKTAVWKTDIVPNRYYAQSSAPEESGIPAWYPVEFNPEHICWVEVRWAEPAGSEGYWQAFRIAGEDLGLDITQEEVKNHITRTSVSRLHREGPLTQRL
jgi:hypothetical protein